MTTIYFKRDFLEKDTGWSAGQKKALEFMMCRYKTTCFIIAHLTLQ